jgi:hypothetical protein
VYTGNAVVSTDNVRSLLEASEFFKLPGIEDLCVEFVQQNTMTVQNTLDMFTFARSTNKATLMDILGGYIADQFDIFSNIDRFLDIPFDDLTFILNNRSSSSTQNTESLLGAITRWIHHRGERLQYLDKLLKIIRFENISAGYMRFVFGKFIADLNNTVLTQIKRPGGYDEVSELPKTALLEAETSLHVFVEHREEKLMRIFSINKANFCSISTTVSQTDPLHLVDGVSNDSHLFCLNHSSSVASAQETNQFQKFCAYTSVSLCPELRLSTPPLIFRYIQMRALQNSIYVYNVFIFNEVTRQTGLSPSVTLFDNEEIRRGVYAYNCEVDNWFPVPKTRRKLRESCFTTCDGSLFLIGGEAADKSIPAGYGQAYDYRIGKWRELPKTHDNYVSAACCAVEEKIYVCGGAANEAISTERYDLVAGKWEKMAPMNKRRLCHKAVNYLNRLWVMGMSFSDGELSTDLSVEVYDPKLNKWSSFPALKELAEQTTSSGAILDAVVFKTQ